MMLYHVPKRLQLFFALRAIILMPYENVPMYRIRASLEGNNSSSIWCSTCLAHFLTMASQTGCEIMNSEVAGSIFTVFPR